MRRACIDIGANTTRLLVADCQRGGLNEVHQERAFTGIGRAIDASGEIPAAKLAEVAAAVTGQLRSAKALGAIEVRCVATAGVRRAVNGKALVELIASLCDGVRVEVLTGEAEARLAFIGAAWGCRAAATQRGGALGVVDIGGGSSELVVGEPPARISWWRSVSIGSSDLLGSSLLSDPPRAAELARASGRVREAFVGIEPPPVTRVVAVGGSAASVTRIVGPRLDLDALRGALSVLQSRPAAAVAVRYRLEVERVRLLPAGLLILERVAELFATGLTVGGAGLREGLLLDSEPL